MIPKYLQTFAGSAHTLSRSPLGILALFLLLVYGFACLVVGFAASLQLSERLPLIWFLVLFPNLVLAVFYRLVTCHHQKLYAPSDYKDEKLFLQSLTETRIEQRLEEEVTATIAVTGTSEMSIGDQESVPVPTPAIPQRTVVRRRLVEVERLAKGAMQARLGFSIQQNVSIMGREFDGIAFHEGTLHIFEFKYFSKPIFKKEFLEAPIHRVASILLDRSLNGTNGTTSVFHIVAVCDFPQNDLLGFEQKVRERVTTDLVEMQITFLQYDDLARDPLLRP